MPLDVSLIQQAGLPKGGGALDMLKEARSYAQEQQKAREEQEARKREAMINQTVQQFGGDLEKAAEALRKTDWQAAESLDAHRTTQRKNFAEMWGKELDNALKLGEINEFDYKLQKLAREAKDPMQFTGTFASAHSQKEWDHAIQAARIMLDGNQFQQVMSVVGDTYKPEQAEFLARNLMGPEKVAANAATLRGQDITMRGQDLSADTAKAGQAVTMRGQDISANTTMRGQDISASTARRGQDLSAAASKEGGGKLSATAIEKVAGVDQSLGMLNDIESLFPDMKGSIGVFDGRMARAKLASGVGIDPRLAEFDAQITGLKNAVIKATTGAAMSEPEAKRIMGQLPDLSLPEAVFKARLETTRRNLETLKRRTIELSGGTAPPESAPASGGSNRVGRFVVEVE